MTVFYRFLLAFVIFLSLPCGLIAQKPIDPCFTSVETLGRFYGSEDLVNLCPSCISNSIASDLIEWDGGEWVGQLPFTYVDLAPPKGCSVRALWMGYTGWTTGGEGFGLRLDSTLVQGRSYTFKFTYASNGRGSDNNFNPLVYTSKSPPLLAEWHYVGRLPPAGNTWKTDSITFTPSGNGDEWIILRAFESSGIVLSDCSVTKTHENFLVSDTTLCEGETLQLSAIQGKYYKYLWSTGSTSSSINVRNTGLYSVEIKNHKCLSYDSSNVFFEDCEVRLQMPNIFTPNGDEFNPSFKPMEYNYLQAGTINIYNRWGEKVFSGNMFDGWNGEINKSDASTGIYFYDLVYTDKKNNHYKKKGTLTLAR